jgi:hypothetical protein
MVIQGIALFAFVPLVLWLLLAQPIGPALSVACAVAIIVAHRAVAAPWAARHARERCLWCGRPGEISCDVPVAGAAGTIPFGACAAGHADAARRFFAFTDRARVPIGLGIFVPLIVLIGGTLLRALGAGVLSQAANAMQFKVIVAATVVVTSVAYMRAAPAATPRSAFPVHNLVLLGIRNTLWVFRLVGGWWLAAAVIRAFHP